LAGPADEERTKPLPDPTDHLTIRNLRANNFSKGLPFPILSENLPEGQVYKEFADGRIEIQEVLSAGKNFQYACT
jgi:hypothetical protein